MYITPYLSVEELSVECHRKTYYNVFVYKSRKTTDRSKAGVPMFLFCEARSLHNGALHVWSCPALCLCVSSVLLAF